MKLVESTAAMSRISARWKARVAFVPTMGALHAGHLSLIKLARRTVGNRGLVVVSIFVNPLQFGPQEDLSSYPRPLAQDLRFCRALRVDVVFHPSVSSMYPEAPTAFVDENTLSRGLCGGARPGHFRGVCTVVAKLFQLVRPDFAIFGQKDYQQLAVIRRMVRDLNFPLAIVRAPTQRERDGLALSSRNAYLTAEQRVQAPALRHAILAGARALRTGERSAARLGRIMRDRFAASAPDGRIDYLEVVDAENLSEVKEAADRVALLGAAFFGRTRLIDNEIVKVPAA
jgi:pantoate--beta-alanine ligase